MRRVFGGEKRAVVLALENGSVKAAGSPSLLEKFVLLAQNDFNKRAILDRMTGLSFVLGAPTHVDTSRRG